ncbi:iron complex transport system substrate-binding protein [Thalassospira sp. MBR-102]|jgi:iron complex transport system substrate-binding protein|uniref:ABC transporter substrate-binding protein n=1 Tax=Thalassospira xiamenensis TaxID=220697 RepID=A0ABR5XZ10_9PROT|nr:MULTISPECIES: ABC transporter substrate-binding protein [Thalassospira]KZD01622.1 ABC transporter substrate-binding protein [Thalassospira xiamenensis]KZD11105.1 ABC transporter substrate-binding protein [Thalassospira xiamenensis]MAB32723.1 ABC transporter substrate-binding protein [Thalassospira sp.]MAL28292.1 ABC transporter substrate-binding protein [Thalassospira sp.]MBA06349.1 ABC transporter substrate-binding protein [Thalassospira sp.]|tara:strand:- start:411 stop:1535 length:1125 start_codon:yes stop_codon:yes gene_type:complete
MKIFGAIAAVALMVAGTVHAAETVTITDVAGREVSVKVPAEKLILGEGRLIYGLATLDTDAPFKRVVGWRDDLKKADPQGYGIYAAKYPEIDSLPTFGGIKDGTFDVEQAISLKPDVIVMNLEAKGATDDASLDKKLAAVGIPLVYIDFRESPMKNTETSMRILGQLTGLETRAEEFIKFRADHIKRVTDRLAKANPKIPDVFIERAAGYSDECCMSFGNENFGKMVELAGGKNIAADIIPGTFGTINPEQVVASNPDQFVGTGGDWEAYAPGMGWVPVGPGADMKEAKRKLIGLTERPAFRDIKATKNNNIHIVWHQFYNSPYQFVVIEQMAKWFHPDLFADIEPESSFRELHERFLPIDYQPGYFISISDQN